MSERKVQIVSLNFVTGEIGYRINDVELNYLVYVDPADAQNQEIVNKAIQDHMATFEPFTAEMLSAEMPQMNLEVKQPAPAEETNEVLEI